MNYLPFVSWGMYGGDSAAERAHFFASWGLMKTLYGVAAGAIVKFMYIYRRFKL